MQCIEFHETISNLCVSTYINQQWAFIFIEKRIISTQKYSWKKRAFWLCNGTISLWFIGAWKCFVGYFELFITFTLGERIIFCCVCVQLFEAIVLCFPLKMLWLMASKKKNSEKASPIIVRHNGCDAWANIHVVMWFFFHSLAALRSNKKKRLGFACQK